jgi:hypothetical protein
MRPADTLRNGQDWLASVVALSCSLTVETWGTTSSDNSLDRIGQLD